MLTRAAGGVSYALRGAQFLAAHPRLWKWVVLPYFVTLILFGLIGWGAVAAIAAVVAWVAHFLPEWLATVLGPLLGVVLGLGVAVVLLYVYFGVATVVAGPFCELLAEAAEVAHTGRPSPAFSVTGLLLDLLRTVAHEARRTLRYLVLIAILGILSMFVPGPGTVVAAVAGFFVAGRFVAWDVLDWTLARRGLGYAAKVRFLADHRGATTGLGLAIAGGLVIPIVGPLFLPIGAVAGMLLVTDVEARAGSKVS